MIYCLARRCLRRGGYTSLMFAAANGNCDVISLLLPNKAEANAEAHRGQIALHNATTEGRTVAVSLLLSHAANVNARTENGPTSLSQRRKGTVV